MDKRIIFRLVILSLLLGSINVFSATTTTSGTTTASFYKINITMVNQEPSPAEAGRYVTIRFKTENMGAENAEDITLELLPKYPFSLEPGETALKYIGSVYSRQIGEIGVITDYRLKVDENALEGDNKIELRYKIKDGEWVKLEPFYINIKPHDIILSIGSINAPKMIKPGETAKVSIGLRNLASTFIKEITIKLNLDSVPFAAIGSTNRKVISQMEAGSTADVSFELMAEPSADSKLYKVPIEVEFFDRLGTKYTKNETIGLIVGAEPDLNAILESSQIYSSSDIGEVSIKFVNKGVTDVKFLYVTLKEGEYTMLSPAEVYVGNIDSDDYETAEFKLAIKKVKEKSILLPLVVSYKDANNNEYTKEVNLPLRIYSASEAKALGLKKGNGKAGIFVVIIVVAAGLLVYRRWRKKKGEIKIRIPFFSKR